MKRAMIERLHDKMVVNGPSGCWEWQVSKNNMGYGQVWYRGKLRLAHRVAYDIYKGGFPEVVMHVCDNPGCINPKHLVAGTQAKNLQDMARKGRGRTRCQVGEQSNQARLTEENIREIRAGRADGLSGAELGRLFGITAAHVYNIINRKAWSHVS